MDANAIRKEMLKCDKNCSAGILKGKVVTLMWRKGSHWHAEKISNGDCYVGSVAFNDALEGARIGLMN